MLLYGGALPSVEVPVVILRGRQQEACLHIKTLHADAEAIC